MGPVRHGSQGWYGLALAVIAAGLCLLGIAANRLTLVQVAAMGATATGLVVMAWLWGRTVRQAETARPLTRGQVVWNAAVFVVWLAIIGALVWWCVASGTEQKPHGAGRLGGMGARETDWIPAGTHLQGAAVPRILFRRMATSRMTTKGF